MSIDRWWLLTSMREQIYKNLGEILQQPEYRGHKWEFVNGGMDLEIAGDTFIWDRDKHSWTKRTGSKEVVPSLYGFDLRQDEDKTKTTHCTHKWVEIQLFTSTVTECKVCGKEKHD